MRMIQLQVAGMRMVVRRVGKASVFHRWRWIVTAAHVIPIADVIVNFARRYRWIRSHNVGRSLPSLLVFI